MAIRMEDDVRKYIESKRTDFRLCTACAGSVILPVAFAHPKPSDIRVRVGKNTLFLSAVQARYLKAITMDMFDVTSCCLLPDNAGANAKK